MNSIAKKRRASSCPTCTDDMRVVDSTPCYGCGARRGSVQRFYAQVHTFAVYEAFGERLLLCNCCAKDLSQYPVSHFGLLPRRGAAAKVSNFQLLYTLDNAQLRVVKDRFCTTCDHRLDFIRFLDTIRSKAQHEAIAASEASSMRLALHV